MAGDRQLRTQFSMKALDLAQMFRVSIGTAAVGAYHAELTAPDGPSTGGGIQAVQHVRLVADDGRPALVVGSCNQKDQTAELRTWDHVDAVHRQRFKRPVDLDRIAYSRFLDKTKGFLEALGMKVALSATRLTPAATPSVARAGSGLFAGFLLGALVVGLGAALALWWLLRHH